MQTLVLATRNAGKVQEMHRILEALPVTLRAASELVGVPKVVEDGATLRANAEKKAVAVQAFSGTWALADDTGLEVAALNGRPGIYAARYAGCACTPRDNRLKLLRELEGICDRAASFRTVVALATGATTRFFEGVCEGEIAHEERGMHGFGYDAIFVPRGYTQTFAELDSQTKNSISHRGQALRSCCAYLTEVLQG